MQRRDVVTRLGSLALAPLVPWHGKAGAQPEAPRRIALLTGLSPDDLEGAARLAAFLQGLMEAGWTVGRNLEMTHRAAGRDADRYRQLAEQLMAVRPEVFVAGGTPALLSVQQVARTLPIV